MAKKPFTPPPPPVPPVASAPIEPAAPDHRRCPLCFGTRQGLGNCYSTQGKTRYYKCGSCGHTWTAVVTLETTTIEHRIVELNERGNSAPGPG